MANNIELLRELGLNQLEAEVYLFAIGQPPMTAYRIAKCIGKPQANVYKAVEVLAKKGALLMEDGGSRTCRAVPVAEFLRRAERDFMEFSKLAKLRLGEVQPVPVDERVYRLETVAQIYHQAREMIGRTRSTVVVDAFPIPLRKLADALTNAARRVAVHVEAYEPVEIAGADVVVVSQGAQSLRAWKAHQLNVVVDGRESMMALIGMDGETVLQAYWSNSLYLSCVHHAGRLCEQTLIKIMANPARAAAILEEHPFFYRASVPGHKELLKRCATS